MNRKRSPEQRQRQIIEVALHLFKEKGYENTTVQDIIDETGISKGGFYHYFSSKEELLEKIGQMFLQQAMLQVQSVVEREDVSALEKINTFLYQVNAYKKEKSHEVALLLSQLYAGGKNVRLENLIFDEGEKAMSPLIQSVILEGVETGDFNTEFPEEAARVFSRLFLLHQKEMAKAFADVLRKKDRETMEVLKRKYMFLQGVLESLLGLEKGSLILEKVAEDTMEVMGQEIWYEEQKKE